MLIPILLDNILAQMKLVADARWKVFYPNLEAVLSHSDALVQGASGSAKVSDWYFTYCRMKPTTGDRWLLVFASGSRRILAPVALETADVFKWVCDLLVDFIAPDIQPRGPLERQVASLLGSL